MDALKEMEREDSYKDKGWIRTRNGVFNLTDPTFDFEDIAHALGMNCRYNGHTSGFFSVAEHSVNVATIMRILGGDPREGLLHDGSEAYLTDVPAPFKQFLPDWRAIDTRVEAALREHFGLGPKTDLCKTADWLALFMEADKLIPGRGRDFSDPQGLRKEALLMAKRYDILRPRCWDPKTASIEFRMAGKYLGLC